MKLISTLVLALALTSCGGGGSDTSFLPITPNVAQLNENRETPDTPLDYRYKILAQPSDNLYKEAGFNGSAAHSRWYGDTDVRLALNISLTDTDKDLTLIAAHPHITHVYLYDELFWSGTGNVWSVKEEEKVKLASDKARTIGLRSVISMTPHTILDPEFRMTYINSVDAIAIDVYPSFNDSLQASCPHTWNKNTGILYCAIKVLRDQGFTGDIFYIYQAFGVKDREALLDDFQQQEQTIKLAPELGVVGLVAWGLYLGPEILAAEPSLFQGKASDFEKFILPK